MNILNGEKLISWSEASKLNLLPSRKPGCEVSRQTWDSYATKGCRGIKLRSVMTPSGRRTKVSWIEDFLTALSKQAGCYAPPSAVASVEINTRLQAARAGIRSITG